MNLFLTVFSLSGQNIIPGDFSCTLDSAADCSTQADNAHIITRKAIIQFMEEPH